MGSELGPAMLKVRIFSMTELRRRSDTFERGRSGGVYAGLGVRERIPIGVGVECCGGTVSV